MRRYATQTAVSPERSRGEIERVLSQYGATGFAYGWQGNQAVIMFEFSSRRMKFSLALPDRDDVALTPAGRRVRNQAQALGKETRRRWRSLALSIKSKLVAVMDGISTVEYEFMAHIVLPNGQTVGEWTAPQIERAYATGNMPPLLPAPRPDRP